MVLLFFAVVGTTNAASVSVDDADVVSADTVKKAISREFPFDCCPAELTLYTTKRGEPGHEQWLADSSDNVALAALQSKSVPADIQLAYLSDAYLLRISWPVRTLFGGAPPQEVIHILVKLPKRLAQSPSRKRTSEVLSVDSTPEWRDLFGNTVLSADSLPPVSGLSAFIEAALPERIRITSKTLSDLKKSINGSLLNKVFVENDEVPCTKFYVKGVLPVLELSHDGAPSEMAHVSFWDQIFRTTLRVMDCGLSFDRDTSRLASTATKRPDFVCTLDDVCVFRGEEKDAGTAIAIPREELRSKMIWTYGSAPYLFGYATSGTNCTLYALVPSGGQRPEPIRLASFKAGESMKDRVRLLLAVLQLTRTFDGIVSRCPDTARFEFRTIPRPNGVVVRLDAESVEKSFPQDGHWPSIGRHLTQVYAVIKTHNVPHCDELIKATTHNFVFQPRGTDTRPKTINELFIAISHVLECLVALHAAGWMHRDLRWDNVLKRRDVENQWFVIDFVDAALSPKQNSPLETLNSDNHAPEIFVEGGIHTTAVDVWGVGKLIDACDLVGEKWFHAKERYDFSSRLQATDPVERLSAVEALAELKRLQAGRSL